MNERTFQTNSKDIERLLIEDKEVSKAAKNTQRMGQRSGNKKYRHSLRHNTCYGEQLHVHYNFSIHNSPSDVNHV